MTERGAAGRVSGRLDRLGRLVEADPALEALQHDAGAQLGDRLAIPQLAAIARLAQQLGAEVSRPAFAASADQDIEMWVKARPAGDDLLLLLDDWRARPAAGPRLEPLLAVDKGENNHAVRLEWSADEQLRLININGELARLLGVEPEAAAGMPLTRLLQLEESDDGDMPLIGALAARHAFSGQRARNRADQAAAVLLSGDVVHGADGSFAGFRGTVEVEAQPGEAGHGDPDAFDQALDDVLREPLDRIIESAGRIVERADGPLRGDYASYGNDIAAAARHLNSVIRDMGDGAIEEGEQNQPLELTALAAEAVVLVDAAAEERAIAIDLQDSNPIPAMGQERAVIQILVNLLGNAIRHSTEGGQVELLFQATAGTASLTVRDHGGGIEVADQQRIFERYEQLAQGSGSAGLGLAISRRLARAMGGDISVDSTPGEGAAFTLTLPSA